MADNSAPHKHLEASLGGLPPQGSVDWATVAIAVPRDFKARLFALASQMSMRPSVLGRSLLMDAVAALEDQRKAA